MKVAILTAESYRQATAEYLDKQTWVAVQIEASHTPVALNGTDPGVQIPGADEIRPGRLARAGDLLIVKAPDGSPYIGWVVTREQFERARAGKDPGPPPPEEPPLNPMEVVQYGDDGYTIAHVIIGTAGEYSERRVWVVAAYRTEAAARRHVHAATLRARLLKEGVSRLSDTDQWWDLSEEDQAKHVREFMGDLDPNCRWTEHHGEVLYHIEAVELNEGGGPDAA